MRYTDANRHRRYKMSICTFGNIITIINDYLKEDTFTQCELMIALFNSFYDDNPDYAFEKTTVNKWIKGVLPVPAILKQYYHNHQIDVARMHLLGVLLLPA